MKVTTLRLSFLLRNDSQVQRGSISQYGHSKSLSIFIWSLALNFDPNLVLRCTLIPTLRSERGKNCFLPGPTYGRVYRYPYIIVLGAPVSSFCLAYGTSTRTDASTTTLLYSTSFAYSKYLPYFTSCTRLPVLTSLHVLHALPLLTARTPRPSAKPVSLSCLPRPA